MPSVIIGGVLNTNSPVQNAGIFVGGYNIGAWDANAKKSSGQGVTFGFGNVVLKQVNIAFDNAEVVDGVINDQDIKIQFSGNV